MTHLRFLCASVVIGLSAGPALADNPRPVTENVLFVMMDGLRWQEVFTGADDALMNKDRGGVKELAPLNKKYGRDTPEERRQALMPFLWGTVAKRGQMFGNQRKGSVARVTNGLNFSYPGYSEVLCGFADPQVTSNDPIDNRNVSVLEWLHAKPDFRGRIAAFASWEVFPAILNARRSGLLVNSGHMPLDAVDTPESRLLSAVIADAVQEGDLTRSDALTYHTALAYLKAKTPRVLFVSFDETDHHGHAGRYDHLLGSANKNDSFVRSLWETMQGMPQYAGKTSLIVTTDHGRGDAPVDWKSHGKKIARSEFIWLGVMGPDTPALGERANVEPLTQSQIAATLAALLGHDYCAAEPRAGKPIAGVVGAAK